MYEYQRSNIIFQYINANAWKNMCDPYIQNQFNLAYMKNKYHLNQKIMWADKWLVGY